MPDHAPYSQAFNELATLMFIELLEDAAFCNEAWIRADMVDDATDDPGTTKSRKKEKPTRPLRKRMPRTHRPRKSGPPQKTRSPSGTWTWPWPPASC